MPNSHKIFTVFTVFSTINKNINHSFSKIRLLAYCYKDLSSSNTMNNVTFTKLSSLHLSVYRMLCPFESCMQ